jgi:hypothetical protein
MRERPAIVRILETPGADATRIAVTLAWQDEEFVGEAAGQSDAIHRPRIIGEATLRAVEAVTNNTITLSLDAIATTDLGSGQIAMAQVTLDGADERLVGSAMVGENDEVAATVKAVLDAINRRLEREL